MGAPSVARSRFLIHGGTGLLAALLVLTTVGPGAAAAGEGAPTGQPPGGSAAHAEVGTPPQTAHGSAEAVLAGTPDHSPASPMWPWTTRTRVRSGRSWMRG